MLHSKPSIAVLVIVMLALADAASAKPRRQGRAPAQPVANAGRLDEQTQKAILSALDDERHMQAFYKAVMAQHGEMRPFSNIVEAEGRHAAALLGLAEKYHIKAPADEWATKKIEAPGTLAAAYREAIGGERKNVAMYDEFLKTIQREDVRNVMSQLRWASQERHLPALERHVGGGQGRGPAAAGRSGNGRGGCCPAGCGAGGAGGGRGWRGGSGR